MPFSIAADANSHYNAGIIPGLTYNRYKYPLRQALLLSSAFVTINQYIP